jgi:hypothetical protein
MAVTGVVVAVVAAASILWRAVSAGVLVLVHHSAPALVTDTL